MKLSNKTLAFTAWGIASLCLLCAILSVCWGLMPRCNFLLKLLDDILHIDYDFYSFIDYLFYAVIQAILGYAFYRDYNNVSSVIVVFIAINLGFPGAIIIALMIVRKYAKKIDLVSKCWFVPAIISLYFFISNVRYYQLRSLGYFINVINCLILGYWVVKIWDVRDKKERYHDSKFAYFADLHNQGFLSDAEFEAKKAEIDQHVQNNHKTHID